MRLHGTMVINKQGHLEIGGCDVTELVAEYGTPLYVMDEKLMRDNCAAYRESFAKLYPNSAVLFASKAFCTMAMCRLVEEEGLGLDVVSGGELYTALRAKFPTHRIYFHGNNKTPDELKFAIESKVGRVVVDNFYELELLNALAQEKHAKVNVLLRIAPGIEAHTHHYIQTGQTDSKFGFGLQNGQALEAIQKALMLKNLVVKGVHCHIGSQIFDLESYGLAAETMMRFIAEINQKSGLVVEELNLGGGLGIYYVEEDTPQAISRMVETIVEAVKQSATKYNVSLPKIIVEPGRSIVGEAGTTLYKIGSIKEIPGIRKYVAVDGGMGDNPRPALYQAKYSAMVANKANQSPEEMVSIAGKCCESGDMLIWDINLPRVESGDILAVFSTGAYNYSMASNYNRIGRPAVIFVQNGMADVVVERETYEDITRNDVIPERMKKLKAVHVNR